MIKIKLNFRKSDKNKINKNLIILEKMLNLEKNINFRAFMKIQKIK